MINRIKTILGGNIIETVLLLIVTVSLSQAMYTGFYISDELASNVFLTAFLSLIILILFNAAAENRKKRVLLIAVIVIIGAAGLIFLGLNQISIRDEQGSSTADYIFYIVTYLTAVFVYLLSRYRYSLYLLTAVGSILIAAVNYLEFPVKVYMDLLFIFGCVLLMMSKGSEDRNKRRRKEAISVQRFAASGICCLAAVLLGSGIYLFVISPMSPGTQSIRLFTRDMTPEIVEKIGIADMYHIPDQSKESNQVDDSIENETKAEQEKAGHSDQSDSTEDQNKSDAKQKKEDASAINYKILVLTLLLILVAAALGTAALLGFLILYNKRRRAAMLRMKRREQVQRMYRYVFTRCRRLGVPQERGESPMEYAERLNRALPQFVEQKIDFKRMAWIFTVVYYGEKNVTMKDYRWYLQAFDQFFICCRKEKGWLKYLIFFH